jgi:hypothetical protein
MNFDNKLYIGLVEDNIDPDRKGRCKVRIQGIFDDIPLNDIPWAEPYKYLAGKSFELPAVGKIVNIIFQNNNIYSPLYLFSQNYNINLKEELNDISDDEYQDLISILFDHRSQIYTNNTDLTIDYKYNKVTIDNDNINVELSNNSKRVNIGTKKSTQQFLLGNNWYDWVDKFVRALQNDPSMLGNGTIVGPPLPIVKPDLTLNILKDYWLKKDSFLSNNINVVDNKKVKKLE